MKPGDLVELRGLKRPVIRGGARYTDPPLPGTVMGPTTYGEYLVVLGTWDGVTRFGHAQLDDISEARG